MTSNIKEFNDKYKSYILATIVKNEEKNLPKLIQTVVNQTLLPKVWFIIDDGSIDNTTSIIENACKNYKWIFSERLPEGPRDMGLHLAQIARKALDNAVEMAHKLNIEFHYIAVLDGDMWLDINYYEFLIERMNEDSRIGIASGNTWSYCKDSCIEQKSNLPGGGTRIWRYQCYKETNGLEYVMSPDTVSDARCNIQGWKLVRFKEVKANQSRLTSSAEGRTRGYEFKGKFAYHLHYSLISVLGRALFMMMKGEIKISLAYLNGFFSAMYSNTPRISDPILIKYFKKKSIHDILNKLYR